MVFGGFFGGGSSSGSDKDSSSGETLPQSQISPQSSPLTPGAYASFNANSSGSSNATRAKIENAITTQTALINAKYLITKINENCFEHCVPDPGNSLSAKEQTCLSTCMEKYIDGWNVVSKTYVARLQKEGAAIQAGQAGGMGSL